MFQVEGSSEAHNASVKLRGLQYAMRIDQPLTGRVGRVSTWYAFKAPEIEIQFTHDARVDLWSLGATLYPMLCGITPFRGEGLALRSNKNSGLIQFDVVAPSHEAQDLVRRLLCVHPDDRWSIDQVLQHPWFFEDSRQLLGRDLSVTQILITDTFLTVLEQ